MASDSELTSAFQSFLATGAWPGARLLSDEERLTTPLGQWYRVAIEGEAAIGSQTVKLRFGLKASFPDALPGAWLVEPGSLGLIPHEDGFGLVCYHREEGLVLNRHAPLVLIQYALDSAIDVLRQGVAGSNREDFMDEFASYWQRHKPRYTVRSLVEPASTPKWIALLTHEGKPEWLADSPNAATKFDHHVLPDRDVRRSLYLPLERHTRFTPPRPDQFWTLKDVRQLIERHVSPENRQKMRQMLRKMLRKRKRKLADDLLVLGLPRPSGGETLVGIEFTRVSGSYPLFPGASCDGPFPVEIERMDRAYLLPRGGATVGLHHKKVLLIGCGALGGHVAMALASAGVGKLTLVDHDNLKPENTFRHVAGKAGIGRHKVICLQVGLQDRYPFIDVQSVPTTIQQALDDKTVDLTAFDAIVVALGVATVELRLNEVLHTLPVAPPIVFTWLEPMGIGGHALLAGGWGRGWQREGCIQCLYTPEDPTETPFIPNRAAFAASGHDYTQDALGCGGAFVPFAGLDAMRTAELATRIVLSALEGTERNHPLVSWKGDSRAFLAQGFTLSDRYAQSESALWERRLRYQVPHCVVCGHAA